MFINYLFVLSIRYIKSSPDRGRKATEMFSEENQLKQCSGYSRKLISLYNQFL